MARLRRRTVSAMVTMVAYSSRRSSWPVNMGRSNTRWTAMPRTAVAPAERITPRYHRCGPSHDESTRYWRYPPDHVELAHGPVDHPHDAVDEGDPHGHQAVNRPDDQPREHVLDEEGRVHPPAPLGLSGGPCRSRSSSREGRGWGPGRTSPPSGCTGG